MDQKLAGEAEFAGVRCVGANEIGVFDARRDSVDGRGAVGETARKNELRARRGERCGRVSGAQIGGEIDRAEGDASASRRDQPRRRQSSVSMSATTGTPVAAEVASTSAAVSAFASITPASPRSLTESRSSE